jgi:regulatory protein
MSKQKVITKIEPQKRNPKRRSVFIDGRFAFGVDQEVVYHLGLKKGENLTEKRIAQIQAGKSENEAKEAALRLLSFRRRTEREIKDKLRQKGFDAKIIALTVEKLKSYDLINDLEFAAAWVKERLALKPRGKRLLRQELWKKGIPRDIIEQTTEELCRDEEKAAVELLKKVERRYKNLEPAIARRRIYGLLTRRGFSYQTAKNAMGLLKSASYDDEG